MLEKKRSPSDTLSDNSFPKKHKPENLSPLLRFAIEISPLLNSVPIPDLSNHRAELALTALAQSYKEIDEAKLVLHSFEQNQLSNFFEKKYFEQKSCVFLLPALLSQLRQSNLLNKEKLDNILKGMQESKKSSADIILQELRVKTIDVSSSSTKIDLLLEWGQLKQFQSTLSMFDVNDQIYIFENFLYPMKCVYPALLETIDPLEINIKRQLFNMVVGTHLPFYTYTHYIHNFLAHSKANSEFVEKLVKLNCLCNITIQLGLSRIQDSFIQMLVIQACEFLQKQYSISLKNYFLSSIISEFDLQIFYNFPPRSVPYFYAIFLLLANRLYSCAVPTTGNLHAPHSLMELKHLLTESPFVGVVDLHYENILSWLGILEKNHCFIFYNEDKFDLDRELEARKRLNEYLFRSPLSIENNLIKFFRSSYEHSVAALKSICLVSSLKDLSSRRKMGSIQYISKKKNEEDARKTQIVSIPSILKNQLSLSHHIMYHILKETDIRQLRFPDAVIQRIIKKLSNLQLLVTHDNTMHVDNCTKLTNFLASFENAVCNELLLKIIDSEDLNDLYTTIIIEYFQGSFLLDRNRIVKNVLNILLDILKDKEIYPLNVDITKPYLLIKKVLFDCHSNEMQVADILHEAYQKKLITPLIIDLVFNLYTRDSLNESKDWGRDFFARLSYKSFELVPLIDGVINYQKRLDACCLLPRRWQSGYLYDQYLLQLIFSYANHQYSNFFKQPHQNKPKLKFYHLKELPVTNIHEYRSAYLIIGDKKNHQTFSALTSVELKLYYVPYACTYSEEIINIVNSSLIPHFVLFLMGNKMYLPIETSFFPELYNILFLDEKMLSAEKNSPIMDVLKAPSSLESKSLPTGSHPILPPQGESIVFSPDKKKEFFSLIRLNYKEKTIGWNMNQLKIFFLMRAVSEGGDDVMDKLYFLINSALVNLKNKEEQTIYNLCILFKYFNELSPHEKRDQLVIAQTVFYYSIIFNKVSIGRSDVEFLTRLTRLQTDDNYSHYLKNPCFLWRFLSVQRGIYFSYHQETESKESLIITSDTLRDLTKIKASSQFFSYFMMRYYVRPLIPHEYLDKFKMVQNPEQDLHFFDFFGFLRRKRLSLETCRAIITQENFFTNMIQIFSGIHPLLKHTGFYSIIFEKIIKYVLTAESNRYSSWHPYVSFLLGQLYSILSEISKKISKIDPKVACLLGEILMSEGILDVVGKNNPANGFKDEKLVFIKLIWSILLTQSSMDHQTQSIRIFSDIWNSIEKLPHIEEICKLLPDLIAKGESGLDYKTGKVSLINSLLPYFPHIPIIVNLLHELEKNQLTQFFPALLTLYNPLNKKLSPCTMLQSYLNEQTFRTSRIKEFFSNFMEHFQSTEEKTESPLMIHYQTSFSSSWLNTHPKSFVIFSSQSSAVDSTDYGLFYIDSMGGYHPILLEDTRLLHFTAYFLTHARNPLSVPISCFPMLMEMKEKVEFSLREKNNVMTNCL